MQFATSLVTDWCSVTRDTLNRMQNINDFWWKCQTALPLNFVAICYGIFRLETAPLDLSYKRNLVVVFLQRENLEPFDQASFPSVTLSRLPLIETIFTLIDQARGVF